MEAEWKDLPFAPGYQVNNLGQMRSQWYSCGAGTRRRASWRMIGGSHDKGGYVSYALLIDGAKQKWWLHRIVAWVFHGDPPFNGAEVRHLNGNPANNKSDNLAWGTHAENQRDMIAHGTVRYGENNRSASLLNFQVSEIVQLWAQGMLQVDLADFYGVSPMTISRIVNGLMYSTITGIAPPPVKP